MAADPTNSQASASSQATPVVGLWTEIVLPTALPAVLPIAQVRRGADPAVVGYHSTVMATDPGAAYKPLPAWRDLADVEPTAGSSGATYEEIPMSAARRDRMKDYLAQTSLPGRRAMVLFGSGTLVDISLEMPLAFCGFARPDSEWRLPAHLMADGNARAKRFLIELEEWWKEWLAKHESPEKTEERAAGHAALSALEILGYPRAGNAESDMSVSRYWETTEGDDPVDSVAVTFACSRGCDTLAARTSNNCRIGVVEYFTQNWDMRELACRWKSSETQHLLRKLSDHGRESLRTDMMYPRIVYVHTYGVRATPPSAQ